MANFNETCGEVNDNLSGFGSCIDEGLENSSVGYKYAFLNGDLVEGVFMIQPLGFESKDPTLQVKQSVVWPINKVLYCLKQTPRA